MKRILLSLMLPIGILHAQEAPPPIVVAEVKVCKLNTTECKIIELVPHEHSTNSLMGCIRAVSMGSAKFDYEGETWIIKGGTCKERPNTYALWKSSKLKED